MPSAIEMLKQDHQTIRGALEFAERLTAKMSRKQEVTPQHVATFMDFIRLFVQQRHHREEEEILFPLLEEKGIHGPIGVMLMEHDRARVLIEEMTVAASEGIPPMSQNSARRWTRAAWNYSDLMYEHFHNEEERLFKMADHVLSAKEQAAVVQSFKRFEDKELGFGQHEQLRATMAELIAQNA